MVMRVNLEELIGRMERNNGYMSKAKVCDRCGKIYSQYDRKKRAKGYDPIKIMHGIDYGKDTDYICEDLCPECAFDFDDFMNKQKDK